MVVLALLLLTLPIHASTVTQGPTPGARIYTEDFSDPTTVDHSAGAEPGLDQTEIDALDRLVQLTSGPGTFIDEFDDPADYTFDPGRITVGPSLATLGDAIFPDLLGYWRMEEALWNGTAGEVLDSSGNGFHGTGLDQATTIAGGRVGRAGTFDGSGDGVVVGQPAALDLDPATDEFTLAAWFRTTSQGALLGKAVDDFGQRQYYLFTIDGRLWGAVGGNQNFSTDQNLNDGQWHHGALVNFDDGGVQRYRLYVDGQLEGTFDSGDVTNTADVMLGARRQVGNTGSGFVMNGDVDEAMIVGRALSTEEIAGLYNGGSGRAVEEFPSDEPPIVRTNGFIAAGLTDFTGFTEVLGPGNQGSVAYQLSTDGVVWRYWNGVSWANASPIQHNDAATVDANINLFDTSAEALFVRAFLISDGTQRVELDRVEVGFDRNFSGLFSTPFDDPVAYTFDPTRVRVESSLARLDAEPDFFNGLLGYWRMEEAGWSGVTGEVLDRSGFGNHGTAVGDATTFGPGQLGRAGTFDGVGDAVVVGQPDSLDLQPGSDEFTIAGWFRTTTQGAILSKGVGNFAGRQYYLFTTNGQLWGAVGGNQNFGSATGLNDGNWHFGALVNFDDSGVMRYRLYIDGVDDGVFLSGTQVNNTDVVLGGRRESGNTGLSFLMDGDLDELMVFDRALSAGEIGQLYNAGVGLVRAFPDDAPTVEKTAGDSDPGLLAYTRFIENLGLGHEGAVGYQLSDDGVVWRFWDGATWAVVGGAADRNDALTVDANIGAFPAASQQLFVRSFLVSDGVEAVELDGLTVRFDTDQGFGAVEILGPITSGFSFDTLTATVTDEDADHQVILQVLDADASTLISDAVLPGNSTGFDSTAAAAGIDLSGLPAGSIYLRVRFTNANGDTVSAALDDFTVTYLDFNDDSDLSVTKTAMPDPVVEGNDLTFEIEVTNSGPSVGFDATLDDVLPTGTTFLSLATPAGWACTQPAVGSGGAIQCIFDELPVGGPYLFRLVVEVPLTYAGPDPIVNTATVSAAKDSDPSDNSATAQASPIPPGLGSLTVIKDADPAIGTDFDFTGDFGPFTLDDAVPDDGDAVFDSVTFTDLPAGTYTVAETLPDGWQLLGIECSSNGISSTFKTPYNDASNYTFESNQVEVSGGIARLRPDTIGPNVQGYWRMEEASWNGTPGEVLDSSGNDFHGVALGGANTVAAGLIDRGGDFDGVDDAVLIGQPPELDLDPAVDEFTLSAWFRTTGTGAIIAKAGDSFDDRQYYMFVFGDRLWASIGGSINFAGTINASNGQWHHGVIVNYNDGGAMRYIIYFDGENQGQFNSGTATNDDDVLIGARRQVGNSGLAFLLDGDIDEAMIIDRALTPVEVLGLYNDGMGRIIGDLPTDGPTIVKTAGDSDAQINAFTSFDVLLGPGHEGDVAYQLSTNGLQWQYWDGVAWVPAVDDTVDRNDAATVSANIGAFDTSASRIFVRAFLLSDGMQQVEIDLIEIGYNGSGLGGTFSVDETLTVGLSPDQQITCTYRNLVDPTQLGSIEIVKDADPADGTDFAFSGDLGPFTLDDAAPDDGDGVPGSILFDDLLPGNYAVTELLPTNWSLDSFNCNPGPKSDTFETPYTVPGNYTFVADEIEVADGVARLLQDAVGTDLSGYWRMEEISWNGTPDEVTDSSGNDLDGVREGDATTFALGQIGRTGTFDGSGDLVNLGQPSALNFNPAVDEFTISAWYKTPSSGALVAKADADFGLRQYYLFVHQDRLWGNVGGNQNQGLMLGALDDEWHHAVLVNFNDGGTMRYRLYFDAQFNGEFLSGTNTNTSDVMFGARRNLGNSGSAFALTGELDEVAIVGRALTEAEILSLYNAGAGRVIEEFPTDGRPVVKTAGDGGVGLLGLTGFNVTYGPANAGTAEFQLSDDGVVWQFWDGAAWTPALDTTERNTEATVDANIAAFDVSADQLFIRTFLVSDGDQLVEVDNLTVTYDNLSDVPAFSVVGETATIQLDVGDDAICTFVNVEDIPPPTGGTLTIVVESDPRLPQDFGFTGDLGSFTLDDALPDDGDGFIQSIVFTDQPAASYQVTRTPVPGWSLVDFRCEGTDLADTSSILGDVATFDVDDGESLTCTFTHYPLLTQLTDTVGAFDAHRQVATSGDGRVIGFISNQDYEGFNGDGGTEIYVRTRSGVQQLSDSNAVAHSGVPAISDNGRYVVFESSGNLLGGNADGNTEIYRFDRALDGLLQVTLTAGCQNRTPTVGNLGDHIAFSTDCDDLTGGFNADGNREVVVWDNGTFHTVETTGCTSIEPALSGALGDLVAFHSDCGMPYTVDNGDANFEVFQWQWALGTGGFEQVTVTDAGASEVNETVASSSDGAFLVFASNADLNGSNADGSIEIFRWTRVGDVFQQLTNGGILVAHSHAAVSGDGQQVALETLDLASGFVSRVDHYDMGTATETPVAEDGTFDSEFPAVAVTGLGRVLVFYQSAADFQGTNTDHNVELWRQVIE